MTTTPNLTDAQLDEYAARMQAADLAVDYPAVFEDPDGTLVDLWVEQSVTGQERWRGLVRLALSAGLVVPEAPRAFTERQAKAFDETVADLRTRGIEVDTWLGSPYWHLRWDDETRPGRGRAFSAVWSDGEHLVQITMDVYGYPTVSIADVDWTHSDGSDECPGPCDRCVAEREAEEATS